MDSLKVTVQNPETVTKRVDKHLKTKEYSDRNIVNITIKISSIVRTAMYIIMIMIPYLKKIGENLKRKKNIDGGNAILMRLNSVKVKLKSLSIFNVFICTLILL